MTLLKSSTGLSYSCYRINTVMQHHPNKCHVQKCPHTKRTKAHQSNSRRRIKTISNPLIGRLLLDGCLLFGCPAVLEMQLLAATNLSIILAAVSCHPHFFLLKLCLLLSVSPQNEFHSNFSYHFCVQLYNIPI